MGGFISKPKTQAKAPRGPAPPPAALVTTEWLAAHLDDPEMRIIDCTVLAGPNKAAEDGGMFVGYDLTSGHDTWVNKHIPGAYFVDFLSDVSDNSKYPLMMPAVEDFTETMAKIGVGNQKRVKVVIYDCTAINMWAARLWWMLDYAGLQNVYILDGGFMKWEKEGRTVETGNAPRPHAHNKFTAKPNKGRFVGADDVAMSGGSCPLVSAQPRAEFDGKGGIHMGRKGHIPGSTNVDPAGLFDPETHAFLPREKLEDAFRDVLSGPATTKVITYCNAGILAALDAFVLKGILGMKDVAVYDGSLAEWISDPARPVVAPLVAEQAADVPATTAAQPPPPVVDGANSSVFEATPIEAVN